MAGQEMNKLREHQLRAFKSLCEVDDIFTAAGLRYYLLAGTTLGAIRHGGFIPWDDDIDIAVHLEDIPRAYGLLRDRLSGEFCFIDNETKPDFPRLFGKVIDQTTGLGCIDVFQLVKTSDSRWGEKLQWGMRKVLFKLFKAKIGYINKNEKTGLKNHLKLGGARVLSLLFSKRTVLAWIHRNEHRYDNLADPTRYVILYGAHEMENETIRAEWLEPASRVTFEGRQFPSIGRLDEYLTNMYGDYKTPVRTETDGLRHDESFIEVEHE